MKKFMAVSALAIMIGFSGQALAQNANQGGFVGPTIAPVTVADAKNLRDDTAVVMVGKIDKNLGGDKYNFTDATGSITVEIDGDDWNGVNATTADTIEIHGEVDKEFTKLEIDVDRVVKK